MIVILKVKGDNYRKTRHGEQGLFTFEIGCDLFTKNPKGESYKEVDKWWLLEVGDFVKEMNDPVVVKVTSKRCNYIFSDSLLEK